MQFLDKTVLVTGAGGPMGFAIAQVTIITLQA